VDTPTVAITYEGMGAGDIEETVLAETGARVVRIKDFADTDVRAADAIMVTTRPVAADFLGTLTRCRIVSRVGVGLDNVDIAAATERGIWVVNVPDYAIDEVATHAVALALAHMRRIPQWGAATRAGTWDGGTANTMRRPGALTFGVLGCGRIGGAAAAKARGLGMRVIAHDPYLAPETIRATGAEPVDWDTLLREADYLSLHTPLTAETRRIVDANAFARMKPGAYLVNTARGGVVDEEALLDALRRGTLAGAGLDVLTVEPPPPDHPLLRDERVTVTPHVAWGSVESSQDVRTKAAQEVVRVLRGERPRYPANEVAGAFAGARHD